MTTPVKKTALTDPDNVMWVVESPAPSGEEVETEVIASTRPKMIAYSELVAAAKISLRKKFDESKVKRGPGGKFAKKAGSKAAASPPAKKTAKKAAAPGGGKKMTNAVIYGKHANGTILETTDGQSRMVFNATGNNWTVQRRTPEGGWETVEVLGKGAAYKRAQELSDSWGAPKVGGDDDGDAGAVGVPEPDPAPAVPSTAPSGYGAFESGWDDLTNVGLANFAQNNLYLEMTGTNADAINPGLAAQAVADAANKYKITPEQVLAIIDRRRDDSVYSDRVRAYLNGQPFPPSALTAPPGTSISALKKAAAAKKSAAPPTPTVAPSPTLAGKKIASTPIAKKTVPPAATAVSPLSQATAGEPFDLQDLQRQSIASDDVMKLKSIVDALAADPGADPLEYDEAYSDFLKAKKSYQKKYGSLWSVKHNDNVQNTYLSEANKASAALTPTPTPAVAPPAKPPRKKTFKKGDAVKTPEGDDGEVVAVATTTGTKVKMTKVKFSDGASQWYLNDELVTPATPPSPPSATSLDGAKDGVVPGAHVSAPGSTVMTVVGQGPAGSTGIPMVTVQTSDGTHVNVFASVLTPLTQDQIDQSNNAPAPGASVDTPHGSGTVVSAPIAYASGNIVVQVKLLTGTKMVPVGDVTATPNAATINAVTPTPSSPATSPGMSYDADGVPILSADQQAVLQSNFAGSGVNWYNDTASIFDAAYAASQATGMSMEDVLKYADVNYHKSAKFGGKPFQAKIEKWAKSSKGKAHIQAKLGTAPTTPTPAPASASTTLRVRELNAPVITTRPVPPNIAPTTYGDTQQFDNRFLPLAAGSRVVGPSDAEDLQSEMEQQFGAMTSDERDALRTYTGSAYIPMNNCLRRAAGCDEVRAITDAHYNPIGSASIREISQRAANGMRPLTQDVTLFRGVTNTSFMPGANTASDLQGMVGQEFNDFGFSSASVDQDIAHDWGGSTSDSVIMQIEVPAGTPAAYVDTFSANSGEYEMVLPPGMRYRIAEYRAQNPPGQGAIIRVEAFYDNPVA